jgi:hypothetical protein
MLFFGFHCLDIVPMQGKAKGGGKGVVSCFCFF